MGVWKRTLDVSDVFHDDDLSFEQKRDAIVTRVKALPEHEHDDHLQDIAAYLADADTVSEFDYYWNDLYDWADFERVWVATL